WRINSSAVSAAFSPAASPPIPSITANTPCARSTSTRSSLRSRINPWWVRAAQRSARVAGPESAASESTARAALARLTSGRCEDQTGDHADQQREEDEAQPEQQRHERASNSRN